jgi:hypothetical protein
MPEGFWPHKLPQRVEPKSGVFAAGFAYQRRATKLLQKEIDNLSGVSRVEPWIRYFNASEPLRPRFCQPDLIFSVDNIIGVVEIKLNWRQRRGNKLRDTYTPLARMLWPDSQILPIIVTSASWNYTGQIEFTLKNILKGPEVLPFWMLLLP